MSPPPTDIVASTDAAISRDTVAIFSPASSRPASEKPHPFGRELAKVDEVAEGFGAAGSGMVLDEEEQEMAARGLHKFSVDDYVAELTGLTGGIYEDKLTLNPWI